MRYARAASEHSPDVGGLCNLVGMWRPGVIVLLVLAISACGEESSNTGNTSGSSAGGQSTGTTSEPASGSGQGGSSQGGSSQGGSGQNSSSAGGDTTGSGGTTTGGGAPRGAISLHVTPNGSCSLGDRWVDLPQLASGHPVTATDHEALLEDFTRDENGWAVTVKCEWLEEEEPYYVSLGITLTSDTDQRFVTIAPGEVSLGQPTTATVLVQDGEANPRIDAGSDAPCSVEVLNFDFEGGTIGLTLSCPALTDVDEVESCQISEGYAYFENCSPR